MSQSLFIFLLINSERFDLALYMSEKLNQTFVSSHFYIIASHVSSGIKNPVTDCETQPQGFEQELKDSKL